MESSILTSRRFWQITLLSLFGVALLYVGYLVSAVLNPILLALVVAYALNPIVEWVEEKGISRFRAVLGVFSLFLLGFVTVIVVGVPLAVAEVMDLYQFLTSGEFRKQVLSTIAGAVETLNRTFPGLELNLSGVRERVNTLLLEHKLTVAGYAKQAAVAALGAMGHGVSVIWLIGSYLFLLPVFAFFFMLHLEETWENLRYWVPMGRRESFDRVTGLLHRRISAFFRGQMLVASVKGVVVLIGLSLLGVPYAVVFGLLGLIGGLVPFLILFLSFIPAVAMMLITQGFTWVGAIGILVTYGIGELLEGAVLYPFVVGREVNMHPLAVIVCLLVGGELLGFFGVLLSIPLGSAAIILTRELVLPNLKEVVHRDREPPPPGEVAKQDDEGEATQEDESR